ncbi:U1 zinc finger domain containing protein [Rhypophila sp. PSN 637]
MPKFFCDYCDVYLTHDSMSVRKAHNSGRNHLRNVVDYYQQIGHEKAQSVIDSITSSYAAEGQAHNNPMLPQNAPGGIGAGLHAPFPPPGGVPPPFNFGPGGLPPPPFPGMPGAPPFGLPGAPPGPGAPGAAPNMRGVPPPFPMPGMPGMPPTTAGGVPPVMPPGGMPFPPPGGLPFPPPGAANFPFPPPGAQGFPGVPPPNFGAPPPGGQGDRR